MSDNKVRPKTKIQALIWNRLNRWDFIPIREWPADLARATLNRDLDYVKRFRLFLYFIGNGMDPDNVLDKLDEMWEYRLPQGYKDHFVGLLKDLKRNAAHWNYWDENQRRFMMIGDTMVVDKPTKAQWKHRIPQIPKKLQLIPKAPNYRIPQMTIRKRNGKKIKVYEEDFDEGTYDDDWDDNDDDDDF